jgi:hypothetical protein
MENAAGADLHRYEDIKALKASGDRDDEIACRQSSRVVAHKRVPALRARA